MKHAIPAPLAVLALATALAAALGATQAAVGSVHSTPAKIPATAIPRLARAAYRFAAREGDPSPKSAYAVATTLARAMRVTTPADKIRKSDETVVYLVIETGHFRPLGIPTPPGFVAPSGPDLELVFEAKTMALLELGVGRGGPRTPTVTLKTLKSLGEVTNLRKTIHS